MRLSEFSFYPSLEERFELPNRFQVIASFTTLKEDGLIVPLYDLRGKGVVNLSWEELKLFLSSDDYNLATARHESEHAISACYIAHKMELTEEPRFEFHINFFRPENVVKTYIDEHVPFVVTTHVVNYANPKNPQHVKFWCLCSSLTCDLDSGDGYNKIKNRQYIEESGEDVVSVSQYEEAEWTLAGMPGCNSEMMRSVLDYLRINKTANLMSSVKDNPDTVEFLANNSFPDRLTRLEACVLVGRFFEFLFEKRKIDMQSDKVKDFFDNIKNGILLFRQPSADILAKMACDIYCPKNADERLYLSRISLILNRANLISGA